MLYFFISFKSENTFWKELRKHFFSIQGRLHASLLVWLSLLKKIKKKALNFIARYFTFYGLVNSTFLENVLRQLYNYNLNEETC